MVKPRAASGPPTGRPPTGGVISRMERPQQNRRSAEDARQTYSGKGRRRRLLEESNAMDYGGFWPIFHAEIVGEEGGEVLFSPLRCFTKVGPTILAASKRPCELHPGAPNPQDLLPPTRHVEWVWRTKKHTGLEMKSPLVSWWKCSK